jgi:Tol biopolymer transport system component/predicted Ser/Thr protein kinase
VATKCPRCQSENPDTQSFCGDCGTPLAPPKDLSIHTKTLETPFSQFAPGTSLANRYEIIGQLGKGGMGEVYLAEDRNLKRQVAIKVLPHPFALDKEREARFEREARLLASLNHPNIATIHGLEKSNGQQFLVMELVEGETLADRISKGSLPLDEALEVCRQIAEGLESAHEKGIIHRDLKPSNVKVTPEGKVKILDFGLAKAFQEESTATDIAKSPTLTNQMTRPGVILGTAAYMSPEQARSRSVDNRSDIWAFGCVLYECLTGKTAFQGDTVSDSLALILRGEPDWTNLPANTPATIKTLLRRCLKKDPSQRLRHIGDARIEVEEASISPEQEVGAPIHRPRVNLWTFVWAGAALIIGITIGLFIMHVIKPELLPGDAKKLSIKLPQPMPFIGVAPLGVGRPSLDISRDGSKIVYVADIGGATQLFLRLLREFESTPIPGTEGAYNPFFSFDSQWIGFFAQNELKKVSISGGKPIVLCQVTLPMGASWGSDNRIVFTQNEGFSLFTIPASGGTPQEVAKGKPMIAYMWPQFLPGNNDVLVCGGTYSNSIRVVSVDKGVEKELLVGGDPKYLSTGHLLYLLDGRLQAVRFDLERLEVRGSPVIVLDDVRIESYQAAQCAISEDGTLVYAPGGRVEIGKLVWLDRNGKEEELPFPAESYGAFQISPDGQKIAVPISRGGKWNIWIYDLARQFSTKFTNEGDNYAPIWASDGDSLIFASNRTGPFNLFQEKADGSRAVAQLTNRDFFEMPESWSKTGNLLAFYESRSSALSDISILSFSEEKEIIPFAHTQFFEWGSTFSPDSKLIAYTSDDQGTYHVYVEPYPKTGERWQISTEGGSEEPVWSPISNELYYRNGNKWMAVSYKANPEFTPAVPRILFEGKYINMYERSYDISPDGQRFLLVKPIEETSAAAQLNVILNWAEELMRKLPTKK